jgi:hypothetical protein
MHNMGERPCHMQVCKFSEVCKEVSNILRAHVNLTYVHSVTVCSVRELIWEKRVNYSV